jgi:hypothetical protein
MGTLARSIALLRRHDESKITFLVAENQQTTRDTRYHYREPVGGHTACGDCPSIHLQCEYSRPSRKNDLGLATTAHYSGSSRSRRIPLQLHYEQERAPGNRATSTGRTRSSYKARPNRPIPMVRTETRNRNLALLGERREKKGYLLWEKPFRFRLFVSTMRIGTCFMASYSIPT